MQRENGDCSGFVSDHNLRVIATLLRIIGKGIAKEAEIGIDTLGQRLLDEREHAGSLYVSDMVFTIWVRK